MNIYQNGRVYNNVYKEYISEIKKEVFTPSLLFLGIDQLFSYFKSHTIVPLFRVLKLRENETVDNDISQYVIGGSIDINKQSGQLRAANITLSNENDNIVYSPRGLVWEGSKIRIDGGVVIDNILYWSPLGVFIMKSPSFQGNNASRTVSLPLVDKWGLWDGSVYGNTEFKTIIPVGVPMSQVFDSIVHENNGENKHIMWDSKDVIIDSNCQGHNTYYTIKQDAGQPKSQLMLDMAKTICADLSYDINGHMRVKNNVLDFKNSNFSPIWRFSEGDVDCALPTLTYNRSKYYNKIITKGAIVNGYQFTASIENTNKKSLYNTYDTPIVSKTNKNSKLFSDQLCQEQCMYEMVQQSRGLISLVMECSFMPFLDVDKMIYLNFPSLNINNEQFIIDGISFNMGTDCKMNLKLTSNNEVVF